MDRQMISRLAHANHPIAAPISEESVRRLLQRAVRDGDERLLDLGCGSAAWLLRALAAHPRATAEGVDLSTEALAEAEHAATDLGVRDRLTLRHQDAAAFTSATPFDVVLNVGASHAFGGLLPTLTAARGHLATGGRLIVGDGFWERPPGRAAVETLGDLDDLPTLVDKVAADGWTPVYGHVSTREELDEYEWSWSGALASWALDNPEHPDAAQAHETAATHRTQWLRGYRDAFGFVCLVLRRTDA
jgi:SAM-dependent methyltransferase